MIDSDETNSNEYHWIDFRRQTAKKKDLAGENRKLKEGKNP